MSADLQPTELDETRTALAGHRTALSALRRENRQLRAERGNLIEVGDRLQSETDRITLWLEGQVRAGALSLPYEVGLAVSQVRDDVQRWTGQRRRTTR